MSEQDGAAALAADGAAAGAPDAGEDCGAATPAAGAGALLKAARERAGVTVEQVAASLRLEAAVIATIEAERFAELSAPVYVRGYLRAYARLLDLEADAIIAEFDAAAAALGDPAATAWTPPRAPRRIADIAHRRVGALFTAIVLLVVAVVAVVLMSAWRSNDWFSETSPVFPAGGETPASAADTLTPGAASALDAPAADAGQMTERSVLVFTFSADSWVEVADRRGTAIFADLGRAGEEFRIVGEAPFTLLVGYAPGVEAVFNDAPVALAPHTRESVARLVVGP